MKLDPMQEAHLTDGAGMPAGGYHVSPGCTIVWQHGPLGRGEDRTAPNGAFVETIIQAARDRIAWYQEVGGGRFACAENAAAINALDDALHLLDCRTKRREVAGTEGTHAEDPSYKDD